MGQYFAFQWILRSGAKQVSAVMVPMEYCCAVPPKKLWGYRCECKAGVLGLHFCSGNHTVGFSSADKSNWVTLFVALWGVILALLCVAAPGFNLGF